MRTLTIAVVAAGSAVGLLLAGQDEPKADPKTAVLAQAYAKYLRTNPRPKLDPFKLVPGQVGVIDTYGLDTSKIGGVNFSALNVVIKGRATIMMCTTSFGENQVLVHPVHYDATNLKAAAGGVPLILEPAKTGKTVLIRGYPTSPSDAEGPRHIPQVLYVTPELLPHKTQGNLMILDVIPAEVVKQVEAKYFAENPSAKTAEPKSGDPAKPLTGTAKLIADLKHQNVETRRKACNELGKLGAAAVEAIPALKEVAAKDSNEFVRKAAAAALLKVEKK
jgi:hypothetical protein